MDCAELNLIQLQLTVHADHPAELLRRLPLAGGRFADLCRDLVCTSPGASCRECRSSDGCGWYCLFAQELSSDPAELRRHQKPPLPFVFSFPAAENVHSTAEMVLGLVVVGSAINHLDLLLDGFAQFIGEMSARLISGMSCDYQGSMSPYFSGGAIHHPGNLTVLSAGGVLENLPFCCSHTLQVQLRSPSRLFENGHLRHDFNFGNFARSLMRRISSLAYYYGDCTYKVDFVELARRANEVICREDCFTFVTGRDRRLSGVCGYGLFEGDFDSILPFLVLGQLFHVGKGASFGMGDYRIMPKINNI